MTKSATSPKALRLQAKSPNNVRVNDEQHRLSYNRAFFLNLVGGIGWALGMTVGFALLVSLISLIFSYLGGLPLIGNFFASIINHTLTAIESKPSL